MRTLARMLLVGLLAAASVALLDPDRVLGPLAEATPAAAPPPARVVYLGGKLPDEGILGLSVAAAAHPGAVLLFDSPKLRPYLAHFLVAYRPDKIIPVGSFDADRATLADRLGVPVEPIVRWDDAASGTCPAWPTAAAGGVVVCPAKPRELLLRAAHLAALERLPLWVMRENAAGRAALEQYLGSRGVERVIVVGKPRIDLLGVWMERLETAGQVEAACVRKMTDQERIGTAVVANPADDGPAGMAVLAPWLAATRRAALLFSNRAGTDVAAVVERAGREKPLAGLDTLLLAGDLKALPVEQRPNPIPGDKDPTIDMEPLTPRDDLPFSYAVGRLFHDDRAVVPLMLARQRLLAESKAARKVLVASNPGGGLSLLETYSRNTVNELRNAGYEVTALFGKQLTADVLRQAMPGHEVFLWEGHHNTLVKEWGFTEWDEPLSPTFVFLQSCLALQPEKVHPLLLRGAVGVLGTSTRTYSGSGGAFSLAFFNALLYEGQTVGGSIRQAKNFLAVYTQLKQKRLGTAAVRLGANRRASWAFTLWGDPTFRLPRPDAGEALPAVRHRVAGNRVVLELPATLHDRVQTDRYQAQVPPNARLAGLVRKNGDDDGRPLVPLVFAEVHLPSVSSENPPQMRSRLPGTHWAFLWDGRRQTGYLLATPRRLDLDRGELRFQVEWTGVSALGTPATVGGGS